MIRARSELLLAREIRDADSCAYACHLMDFTNLTSYLYGENSRDKLKTTCGSLTRLLTYHQVMPTYLDFILVFGAQSDAKDLRFSGFREQIRLKISPSEQSIPDLGRSGRLFQMCYNLKGVQFKSHSNESIKLDEWSIRQAAFYHQFDVEYGTTLWIATKGGKDVLKRYKELVGANGRPEDKSFNDPAACFRSSLSVHLLFCHWSTEDWRWYIRWLEEVLDHEVTSPSSMWFSVVNEIPGWYGSRWSSRTWLPTPRV